MADRVALEQGPGGGVVAAMRATAAGGRPPTTARGRRLVDEHVILAGKSQVSVPGSELVATFVEQIGGGAAHHEVELQLGVAMRARRAVGRGVTRHASVERRAAARGPRSSQETIGTRGRREDTGRRARRFC